MRYCFTWTPLVLSLVLTAAAASPRPAPPALISVPKDASQADALAELQRKSGLLVLAEKTQVQHLCEHPLEQVPLQDAILAITSNYHLHAMIGARQVVFVRRFWDPKELPDFPTEEVRSIVTELHRLVSSIAHPKPQLEQNAMHRAFYASLNAAQLAAARSSQLRYLDLTPDQRKAWTTLTEDFAYLDMEGGLSRVRALLDNSKAAYFRWVQYTDSPPMHTLSLIWPYDNGDTAGRTIVQENQQSNLIRPPGRATESSERLLPSTKPITECRADCGEFEEPASLGSIVDSIGRANHINVQVPAWARSREYYLFARGHSGDEALQAVANSYGWRIRAVAPHRFSLERPVAAQPADAWDFYRQVRAIVPPEARLLAADDDNARIAAKSRSWREHSAIREQVLKLAPEYQTLPFPGVDPTWQRRVVDDLFASWTLYDMGLTLNGSAPQGYLARPDAGFFSLKGGPVHPVLEFFVLRDTGDPQVKEFDSWGWVIGSEVDHFP